VTALYIVLSSWLSACQKLSNLVEIWRSSDKSKLGHFLAHHVYSDVDKGEWNGRPV